MKKFLEDGWESDEAEEFEVKEEYESVKFKGEKGLSILQAKHHSLEPDMISGWKPKLPSCPLPLSYPNSYVDSLISHLAADEIYSIVYKGPRYSNSVQINQKYNYPWRYRDRYNLNLGIVQEAVKKVGNEEQSKIIVTKNNHTFDSAFESGNLDLAVRVKKNEYDCFIRSDTNTKGHTNWYYFEVKNTEIGPMKINICNMTKHRNLYMKGMKPFVKVGKNGKWSQETCFDVLFVERYCRYGLDKKTNQLQFTFKFTELNQTVYFAYSVPYTYSDLELFISEIKEANPELVHRKKLCESLGGVELPLLTITNEDNETNETENSPVNESSSVGKIKKKAILITARIHPGESNSSHVVEGFIRELLRNSEGSNILRNMFVFYIVPMLNPDGVIAGNFRTSYSGKDLNRQFNNLNKYVFPEVTSLCEFTTNFKKQNLKGIEFYFDFHGHSAKKNLFCYGPEHLPTKIQYFKSRALAKIIEQISPIFSYRKSIFTISECKKNTGRAYMLRTAKIPMTFAFEISNGLYENEHKKDVYLDRKILLDAGEIVLKGLYRYAQLEMKIPKINIKAKVDTGNIKPRFLKSAGSNPRPEIEKKKSSHESNEFKQSKNKSVNKSASQEKMKESQNNEFINLIKEIKKDDQENKEVEVEGGSDSESSNDDFTKEETNKLFEQIQKRTKESYGFIIREKKKQKTSKIPYRKQELEEENIENEIKDQGILENKKIRSNRMIDISKPPIASIKNIKRGNSVEYEKVVLAQKNFTMLL